MNNKFDKRNGFKHNFDSIVVDYVDNLKKSGIDTIGIYLKKYVGALTDDSCECGIIPWVAYIQWIKYGITYHQKITRCCKFNIKTISNSALLRYYANCRSAIDKGFIMPVITGAFTDKNGDLQFIEILIDHTTCYSIYCYLNGKSKFVTFQEYELESNANLFHYENLTSIINSWRKIIDNQINDIENE